MKLQPEAGVTAKGATSKAKGAFSGHTNGSKSKHRGHGEADLITPSVVHLDPGGSTEVEDKSLEDELTNEKLKELEQIFESADEDGGGGLDMDEFRIAMRQAMGDHLTDHEFDIIFMKVDTNCDGTVDWDEYISYMLLEYREKDQMNFEAKAKPLPQKMRRVPNINLYQRHHDSIIKITSQPNICKGPNNLYKPLDDHSGRYVTVTKAGVVNYWTTELKHLKTNLIEYQNKNYQRKIHLWVTDFVCMPNLNMVAVATTFSTITFYDLCANKFDPIRTLVDLEICVTCMDYWISPNDLSSAQLIWGDARGNICGLVFLGDCSISFLQPSINKHFKASVSFVELLKYGACGVKAYKLHHVHDDFVLRIKYLPQLNTFMSCCRDRNTALFQGDLPGKKAIYFKVRKGVFDFDYCRSNNVLVTGGKDSVVRVWNPYVQSKPVMLLHGHKTAIIFVTINESKEQIISVSEDKEINVFDMSTQTCIQTIFRKWVELGARPISAVFFNPMRQALVLASNQLAFFEHQEEELCTQHLVSHTKPVTVAMYNTLFDQVVSGGADSLVCIWDVNTGEKIIQFSAHKQRDKNGEETEVEITAMQFDPTKRRLVTAARDGKVKIWNFNNGALLREFEVFDNKEITSIMFSRSRILTAGWNRKITVYMDSMDDESVVHWRDKHTEDILSLVFIPPSTIASSSYDGEIYLWYIETGNPFNRLDSTVSTTPLFSNFRHSSTMLMTSDSMPFDAEASKMPSSNCPDAAKTQLPDRGVNQLLENIKAEGSITNDTASAPLTSCSTPRSSQATEVSSQSTDLRRRPSSVAIDKLLALETRPFHRGTASLVASGGGGWVRFWSTHPNGGLLGQFNACHTDGESVHAMCTDERNEFLVTGDSAGYIKVWDISNYCTEDPVLVRIDSACAQSSQMKKFDAIKKKCMPNKHLEDQTRFKPPDPCTMPEKTWKAPPLLNSFRAHLQAITYLDYINMSDTDSRVLSSSFDCSIRLSSIYGEFFGIYGQEVPWCRPKSSTASSDNEGARQSRLRRRKTNRRLPADVRRVASATTLRVLFGGMRPDWRLAKNIMSVWVPLMRLMKEAKERQQSYKSHLGPMRSVLSAAYNASMDKASSDSMISASPTASSLVINRQEILSRNITSDTLGKSYTQQRKHQKLPEITKIRPFQNLCNVYSSLPCYDLDPVDYSSYKPPQTVLDIQQRMHNLEPPPRRARRRTQVRVGKFMDRRSVAGTERTRVFSLATPAHQCTARRSHDAVSRVHGVPKKEGSTTTVLSEAESTNSTS